MAVVAIPFAHLWVDWLTALLNSRQDGGLLYSVWSIPPLLIPLVSGRWVTRASTVAGGAFADAATRR